MECSKVSELIMKDIDGNITIDEKNTLKQHINDCVLCREEYFNLKESMELFNDIEEKVAPDEIENIVMNKIDIKRYSKEQSKLSIKRKYLLSIPIIYSIFFNYYLISKLFNLKLNIKAIYVSIMVNFINFVTVIIPKLLITAYSLVDYYIKLISKIHISVISIIVFLIITEILLIKTLKHKLKEV